MKKRLIFICLSLLLLTGCGSEKTMTCTRTLTQAGIHYDLTYEITYKGSNVIHAETIEKMSGDIEALTEMKETLEKTYADYNEIEHFSNEIVLEDEELISTTNIDYSKIDIDALTKLDSSNSRLFTKGKVKLKSLKEVYEGVGASCK